MTYGETSSEWLSTNPVPTSLRSRGEKLDRCSGLALRPLVYLLAVLAVGIIITVFSEPANFLPNANILAPTGFVCVGVFLWQVRSVASGLLRLTFTLLAAHAVIGYMCAASILPFGMSGTLDDRAFSLSFAVVAAGLMVAALAFQMTEPARGWLPKVDSGKIAAMAIWVTLAATATILFLYDQNHLLPWQNNLLSMAALRYEISGLHEWIINRCLDLLMLTIPLLMLFRGWARLFAVLGLAALALTFVRAPILDIIMVITLANVIRTGKARRLILIVATVACVYAGSQLFFFGVFQGHVTQEIVYHAVASSLPEVRDLGWILWLNGHELHWGATLVQSVLPVPSIVSPWFQEHGLRGLTTRMIGYNWDEMGGLRLTLAGEGYLNFGFVGTMLLCALWGWGLRKISGVIKAAGESGGAIDSYFASLLLSWLAFWIYLGGSQSSGVVRSSVLLLAATLYVCRLRSSPSGC